jgi:ABC-type branched-subunit amino acid transport system substrate-binding protein
VKFPVLSRRQVLAAGGAAVAAPLAWSQGARHAPGLTIAQIHDTSATQQDVSKDFLIGSRAAWQDINSRGGVRGRPVVHQSIETNGSRESVRAAVAQLKDNPACILLCGTAGDIAATRVLQALREAQLPIAHVAPWLQNSTTKVDERTFPIFAARQEQVAHALKSLSAMNIQDIGVVYASESEYAAYQDDVARVGAELKVRLQAFRAAGELQRLGQRLTPTTPAVLLFVGGTPELVQFTQGLDRQSRQRYVVALADVNLQTMVQMGAARTTPVIATQAVPVVSSALPIVRTYRDVMGRLFDEPPAALSLAGFIAARYAYEVLADIDVVPSRQAVLAAFQRRANVELGGYRIAFDPRRRSATYVTQSMLTQDGRVIG